MSSHRTLFGVCVLLGVVALEIVEAGTTNLAMGLSAEGDVWIKKRDSRGATYYKAQAKQADGRNLRLAKVEGWVECTACGRDKSNNFKFRGPIQGVDAGGSHWLLYEDSVRTAVYVPREGKVFGDRSQVLFHPDKPEGWRTAAEVEAARLAALPSCAGKCGEYNPDRGCSCDASCEDRHECCHDYGTVCEAYVNEGRFGANWRRKFSKSAKSEYWFHEKTKQTNWEQGWHPRELTAPKKKAAAAPNPEQIQGSQKEGGPKCGWRRVYSKSTGRWYFRKGNKREWNITVVHEDDCDFSAVMNVGALDGTGKMPAGVAAPARVDSPDVQGDAGSADGSVATCGGGAMLDEATGACVCGDASDVCSVCGGPACNADGTFPSTCAECACVSPCEQWEKRESRSTGKSFFKPDPVLHPKGKGTWQVPAGWAECCEKKGATHDEL